MNVYVLFGIPLAILLLVPLVLYSRRTHRGASDPINVIKSGEPWIHWSLREDAWRWYLTRLESREEPRAARKVTRALRGWMGCLVLEFMAASCLVLLVEHSLTLGTELSLLTQLGSISVVVLLSLALAALWIKVEGLLLRRARGEILICSTGILIPGYHCTFGRGSAETASSIADARVMDSQGVRCLRVVIKNPRLASRSGSEVTVLEIPIPMGCEEEAQDVAKKMRLLEPRMPGAIDPDQEDS